MGSEDMETIVTDGARIHVRRATENDLSVLLRIVTHYREDAAGHVRDIFTVERSQQAQIEGLQEALASADTAFFLAGMSQNAPTAAMWCRHAEKAPPVYQPGRSILFVKPFYTSAAEVAIVGSHLLDAAVTWAKDFSETEGIFVSSITWAHDSSMRQVIENFHKTSKLLGSERYRELFQLEGEDARMRPATEWYFSRSQDILSALTQHGPPSATVRLARSHDLPSMVKLSRQKRHDYARYQPVFWRPAEDADQKQIGFFGWLLQQEAPLLFVSEASDGSLSGFLIALPTESLAMKDPAFRLISGLHIDDFTVAEGELWATAGRELLMAAVTEHQRRNNDSAVVNVISGTHDLAKRRLLERDAHMRSLFTWDILPAGNLYKGADT
ncbi:MAG: hypothetical protein RL518_1409 [Pseudomonadota bacterium]